MAGTSPPHPGSMLPGMPGTGNLGAALEDRVQLAEPPLPRALTPNGLREAISSVLERVRAHDLAEECVRFGLPPREDHEDGPGLGKRRYVDRRIRHWKLPELLTLARDIASVYDDDRLLNHLIALFDAHGVRGDLKNLIFAATGPKPKIVLRDAINNDLEIVGNARHCLVYDRPLPGTGLTWRQLTAWWARSDSLPGGQERAEAVSLYRRLMASMGNEAERFIFDRYCARYGTYGFDIPALIPQVYLNYDPYTRRSGGTLSLAANRLPAATAPPAPRHHRTRRHPALRRPGRPRRPRTLRPDGRSRPRAPARRVRDLPIRRPRTRESQGGQPAARQILRQPARGHRMTCRPAAPQAAPPDLRFRRTGLDQNPGTVAVAGLLPRTNPRDPD